MYKNFSFFKCFVSDSPSARADGFESLNISIKIALVFFAVEVLNISIRIALVFFAVEVFEVLELSELSVGTEGEFETKSGPVRNKSLAQRETKEFCFVLD